MKNAMSTARKGAVELPRDAEFEFTVKDLLLLTFMYSTESTSKEAPLAFSPIFFFCLKSQMGYSTKLFYCLT